MSAPGETKPVRLLIVEDARHVIDDLRDAFTGSRFECEVALDIRTALDILAERHMDAVVVDARLVPAGRCAVPDLIGQLKSLAPLARVVIFNGVTSSVTQRRLRRLGADGYLSKNSDLASVERSIRRRGPHADQAGRR